MKTLAQFKARYDFLLAILDVLSNLWDSPIKDIDLEDPDVIENIKDEMGEMEEDAASSFVEDLTFLVDLHKKKLIKVILSGSYMSENDIGGDDVIEYIDDTLEAIKEGWTIETDYVDGTAWVIGFKDEV